MKNYSGLPKYHLGILILYAVLIPLLFNLYPDAWKYGADWESSRLGFMMILACMPLVYIFYRSFGSPTPKRQRISLSQVVIIFCYALAFAFPEEIIFRGIIQAYLQTIIQNTGAAIILSALIFGLAHLPNGSRGIHPRKWNWRFAGVAFCGGLIFGLLFAMTQSLLYPTILHTSVLIFFGFYLKK
jgi:membrane protease YdiL (CAAX protease family)